MLDPLKKFMDPLKKFIMDPPKKFKRSKEEKGFRNLSVNIKHTPEYDLKKRVIILPDF